MSDGKEADVSREPEVIKAFRDTWELGVHSYLSYWRDRFLVARELLTETGSMFVQIGDENVHLVRSLMDEVFGRENYVAQITFVTTSSQTSDLLSSTYDYIVWYAKSRTEVKYNQLYSEKEVGEVGGTKYKNVEMLDGTITTLNALSRLNDLPSESNGYRIFRPSPMVSQSGGDVSKFPVSLYGQTLTPRSGYWKTGQLGVDRLRKADRLMIEGNSLAYIRYLNDFAVYPYSNLWDDTWGVQSRTDPKVYVVQTSTEVFKRCLLMTSDPGDLVLDPTCGSGTTAYVAEQWGRRWMTVDSSRVALALARTRLMTAKFPAYLLQDSDLGAKKEAELSGMLPSTDAPVPMGNIHKGYVYRRVPRITLKSIANNVEIDTIDAQYADRLTNLLAEANAALGTAHKAWELPRAVQTGISDVATQALMQYWKVWRERKAAIDASIACRAETVYLVDKPFEDYKSVRVAGAFTVESLSPHRIIAPESDEYRDNVTEALANKPDSATTASDAPFETSILAHLLKAGVQNTKKGERLEFEELSPYGGSPYIHGAGIQKETGTRIGVSIGARYGTVSKELVNEAVKAALKPFEVLLLCGFAFDPAVHDEAETLAENEFLIKRYGKLTVQFVRINHDLMVGAGYLKNTGAGNLFTVFGEPDIVIQPNGVEYTVTIRGVDIFNPQTSEAKSYDTKDIACWFVDTNYDGEHFVVRHAYFTGGNRTYDGLAKTLKGDLNDAAWDALYSNISRPFTVPDTGRIAVKVINHYGDEVVRVYRLPEDLARFKK